MDQILRKSLEFDRFALDLTRGCLRIGETEVDLRPKTFEVLRHLAENAGQLVSKQSLYEAVWPDVTVTEDSLVQCIRELRQHLGDDDRSLIKTVSRRGYLLNAAPLPQPGVAAPTLKTSMKIAASDDGASLRAQLARHRRRLIQCAAGLFVVVCVVLTASILSSPAVHPAYPVSLDFKPALLPSSQLNKL